MIRILILSSDEPFGIALADSLKRQQEPPFDVVLTTTVAAARQSLSEATQTFDVLLIDQQLDSNQDGITIFQELHQLIPDMEAIIFTNAGDQSVGLRAYRAGVFRYLTKPFNTHELIWLLQMLHGRRDTLYERDWLKILTEVAEEAQHALTVQEVANIVVQGGLSLGFERARLWRLHEDGLTLVGVSQAGNEGLADFEGFLTPLASSFYSQQALRQREPVFFTGRDMGPGLPDQGFAARGFEPPVGEWVDMALWAGDTPWGILTLDNAHEARQLRPEQRSLLGLFGRHVSAALERARLYEQETRKSQELEIINRASQEIMKLAEESDDWLWHAALTVTTAKYGFGFHRAILLHAQEGGTRLREGMQISYLERDRELFSQDALLQSASCFDAYLKQLRSGLRQLSAPPSRHADRLLDLNQDEGALRQGLRQGRRVHVPADQVTQCFPASFIERFGVMDYILLPLQAGKKLLGLVAINSLQSEELLRTTTLDQLETFFARTALIYENVHQRRSTDRLIDLNYTVLAEIGRLPLKKTLKHICEATQKVTGADCVVIYPLRPDKEPYEFDLDNIGSVGQEYYRQPLNKARHNGLTGYILRSGMMVVDDIAEPQIPNGGQKLSEHPFIRRERIRAFIGTRVRDMVTGVPVGLLYLNYRTPATFTQHEKRQAEAFASLAAIAIRNARNLKEVEDQVQERGNELRILREVLEEALIAQTSEDRVIGVLLHAACELLGQPDARVELHLRKWAQPIPRSHESHEVRHHYYLQPSRKIDEMVEPELDRGITGLALRTGKTQLVPDVTTGHWPTVFYANNDLVTRSELDVPINLEGQAIGVFNVESPAVGAFTESHQAMLERLAAAASLALDNVRRQEHLRNVLAAAQAVMEPSLLPDILEVISGTAQHVALGISALTIWYLDPDKKHILLGPHFGVRSAARMRPEEPAASNALWAVTNATDPIWAVSAQDEPRLRGRFVTEEQIESVAAFPLRANNEIVGAMFFNYRQRHEFTSEERVLFPIIAAIAAASIRDAVRLEDLDKKATRLEAALAIIDAVGTILDISQVRRKILETLRKLFPSARPFVLSYDWREDVLKFTPESKDFYIIDNPEYRNLSSVPLAHDTDSIASRVARLSLATKKVEVVNQPDVSGDRSYLKLILDTQSELCISLMSDKRLLGVLALESPMPAAFNEDDVALVRRVAQQVSVAFDRAHRSVELRFKTIVAARTAWAAEIAHDINREVFHIRNRTYWLNDEMGLSETGHKHIREIGESAARLAGTLRDANPRYYEAPQRLLLDRWLQGFIPEILKELGVELHVIYELTCGSAEIQVHPATLQRILRHLVRNALNAMSGAGTLMVRSCCKREQWVEIEIEDTGPGVPEDVRQMILEQPVNLRGNDGGVGLLFVRFAVEEMGGTIELLPLEVGRGAVFVITLPVSKE
jgi:GAF domain-containing protein